VDRAPVRVLIAEDNELLAHALTALLESSSDVEVVAVAHDGAEALEVADRVEVDVVVMDVTLPRLDGIEATRRLRERRPQARVVIVSGHDSETLGDEAAAAGAVSYLRKGDVGDELLAAVLAAAD
jgi:DNA-binding NarL/FixJ family response regulator